MYPFVPGCSTQKYFPYDEEENAEQYKKVQKQRELERKVRASKRECMMLKDGDPEAFQKASIKLKHNTQQLKTYCSSNDLTYMNERTTVMGYGRSEAGKVTAAYNRALKQEQEKLNKVVDISGGSGIINEKIGNGDITLTLNPEKQAPHMQDTRGDGKSYFTINFDELQEIINEKHGTGEITIYKNGQIKEVIDAGKIIGFDLSSISGEVPTDKIKIHYSKKRTHAVPTLKEIDHEKT